MFEVGKIVWAITRDEADHVTGYHAMWCLGEVGNYVLCYKVRSTNINKSKLDYIVASLSMETKMDMPVDIYVIFNGDVYTDRKECRAAYATQHGKDVEDGGF